MQNKSDVEIYWDSIRNHERVKDPRTWQDLTMQEKDAIIRSINLLLIVLNNGRK